jgi:hypothetical protein
VPRCRGRPCRARAPGIARSGDPAAGIPGQCMSTERRQSRTDLPPGYDGVPVLKTGWGTGPRRSASEAIKSRSSGSEGGRHDRQFLADYLGVPGRSYIRLVALVPPCRGRHGPVWRLTAWGWVWEPHLPPSPSFYLPSRPGRSVWSLQRVPVLRGATRYVALARRAARDGDRPRVHGRAAGARVEAAREARVASRRGAGRFHVELGADAQLLQPRHRRELVLERGDVDRAVARAAAAARRAGEHRDDACKEKPPPRSRLSDRALLHRPP